MEFVDDGRLANTRIPGNEHQFRQSASNDTVDGGEEGLNFGCSPVQFFGNQQPVWYVVLAKREFGDAPLRFPYTKTAAKITLHAGRRLVAFLGSFGDQFHHDRRKTARQVLHSLVRRHRMARDVTMYPL